MGSRIIGSISKWDQIYPDWQVPNYFLTHMYRKMRTILNILLLSGQNYFNIISFWRNKINSNKKLKKKKISKNFYIGKIKRHAGSVKSSIKCLVMIKRRWQNAAGKSCFPSHSSPECLWTESYWASLRDIIFSKLLRLSLSRLLRLLCFHHYKLVIKWHGVFVKK